jgi:hypothetical protein
MAARMEEVLYLKRSGKSDHDIFALMKYHNPSLEDDFIRSLIQMAPTYILGQNKSWLQKIAGEER